MNPLSVTADYHAQDLKDTRETDPLYAAEGIVHPGTILRCCNWVLSHNVVLPAWMHVGSKVQNLGIARIGDTLSARARVTQNYEHKGHKFVEVDALVLANERTPLARVTHIAIYRPRAVGRSGLVRQLTFLLQHADRLAERIRGVRDIVRRVRGRQKPPIRAFTSTPCTSRARRSLFTNSFDCAFRSSSVRAAGSNARGLSPRGLRKVWKPE